MFLSRINVPALKVNSLDPQGNSPPHTLHLADTDYESICSLYFGLNFLLLASFFFFFMIIQGIKDMSYS